MAVVSRLVWCGVNPKIEEPFIPEDLVMEYFIRCLVYGSVM